MKLYVIFLMWIILVNQCSAMFDSFDHLSEKWRQHKSSHANISVDTKRGVLVLSGMQYHFNYIERKLSFKEGSVQVDVNSGNDNSASWATSFVLYWDKTNYLRVLVTPAYGLLIIRSIDGVRKNYKTGLKISMANWYRIKVDMNKTKLNLYFSPVGGKLKKVLTVPRYASLLAAPAIILGKGNMRRRLGYAHNASRRGQKSSVEFDNFATGNVDEYVKEINAGAEQRKTANVNIQAKALKAVFWPQQTKKGGEIKTLWVVPGRYQRLSILYANFDSAVFAQNARIEISVPKNLGIKQMTFGIDDKIKIEQKQENDNILYSISRETNWKLPPGLHGYASLKNTNKPGWREWPENIFPELAVYFVPQKKISGEKIKARLVCNNVVGDWTELDIKEMPPLPPLLKDKGKGANVTLHILDLPITGMNKYRGDIIKNMFKVVKRLGVMFIISSKAKDEFALAKSAGIIPLLGSNPWWHYSTQCPRKYKPTANEKASEFNITGSDFCPVIIAEGQGTYGKFLEEVTRKTASSGAEGFYIDYECRMPFCYCERCRKAFIEYTGKADVKWPSEVKKNTKYYDSWISFRCWQGALYVKAIRDAVWKALPDSPVRAWVTGYNYRNNLKRSTIDVSKASKFLTEVEIPHYSLPYNYDDRIKSLEQGIKVIKDTVAVVDIPIIFCSSIDYPIGSVMWSDPDILDAQIMAIIGEGAQGVSFWGGHFQGAIDGRFMHKLVKWHNLLVSSVKYLRNGKREDKLLKISGNKKRLYSSLRVLGNKALVTLVNLSQQQKDLTISVPGFKIQGYTLPYKSKVINLSKVSIKPLEGIFIELQK